MGLIEYEFYNGLQPKGLFERQPYREAETGVVVFTGRQGSGKTTCAFEYLRRLEKRYGDSMKLYANMPTTLEHEPINAKDIYDYKFDTRYQNVCLIDEISTLFSALSSTKLDQSVYQAFCQLRKRGVLIISTAQRFDRITTAIREQCNLVIDCSRLGRLQLCRVYNLESSNKIEDPRPCYFYFYFPTKKTYDLFESEHIIKE